MIVLLGRVAVLFSLFCFAVLFFDWSTNNCYTSRRQLLTFTTLPELPTFHEGENLPDSIEARIDKLFGEHAALDEEWQSIQVRILAIYGESRKSLEQQPETAAARLEELQAQADELHRKQEEILARQLVIEQEVFRQIKDRR